MHQHGSVQVAMLGHVSTYTLYAYDLEIEFESHRYTGQLQLDIFKLFLVLRVTA